MNTNGNTRKADADFLKMLIIAFSIFIVMVILNGDFAKSANITSMLFQLPELGLYSLAMMMSMLTNGIDLSVVAIGNLSAICAARVMSIGTNGGYTGARLFFFVLLGILAALCIGILCGLVNGLIIAYIQIPPMLATMATSLIIGGISIINTKGHSVNGAPEQFTNLGGTTFMKVPYSMWVMIGVIAVTGVILYCTRFGFEVKMTGSNPKASHYTGMNVKKILVKAYLYCGIVSSICGVIILMRTNAAKADYAATYVMQAILCCVLGATNPNGGTAKLGCMILALLSLQFLSSGFNMLHLDSYFKQFTWGLLLIVVLAINYLTAAIVQKRGQHKAS
ncbi:MAG: ABC transporter permease [Lachnospiraceae bacterium]|nr:ABC transporter permease [Lachnospiraceae bacterium]